MTMLASQVRWSTDAIRAKLAQLDDEIELAHIFGSEGMDHFGGVRHTLTWVLGEATSPLHDVYGYSDEQHRIERTQARWMVEDNQYGNFSPAYVLAVHRTFRWLSAGEDGEAAVVDPVALV